MELTLSHFTLYTYPHFVLKSLFLSGRQRCGLRLTAYSRNLLFDVATNYSRTDQSVVFWRATSDTRDRAWALDRDARSELTKTQEVIWLKLDTTGRPAGRSVVHSARINEIKCGRPDPVHETSPTGTKVRYDTIRDAILTCAQVSLIYRTERTTKKWEKENQVSKPGYAQK